MPATNYHMLRRGDLPQSEQFCLLSLSFKGRDCDMPAGVAAARRDAAFLKGVLVYASNGRDQFHATRAKRSLGRGRHGGILPPERAFLCPLKGEKKNIQTPYQTVPTGIGNRAAGTRGTRSQPFASTRVVDAALGIDQNDDSMNRRQFGT